MRNKYTESETVKITSSCGICKIKYFNGSYLLLFGKNKMPKF